MAKSHKSDITIHLTPLNTEWISMIPTNIENLNIVLNRIILESIESGDIYEIIKKSLNSVDSKKFENNYQKLYTSKPINTQNKTVSYNQSWKQVKKENKVFSMIEEEQEEKKSYEIEDQDQEDNTTGFAATSF